MNSREIAGGLSLHISLTDVDSIKLHVSKKEKISRFEGKCALSNQVQHISSLCFFLKHS